MLACSGNLPVCDDYSWARGLAFFMGAMCRSGEGLSVFVGATCHSCAASDVGVLTFE